MQNPYTSANARLFNAVLNSWKASWDQNVLENLTLSCISTTGSFQNKRDHTIGASDQFRRCPHQLTKHLIFDTRPRFVLRCVIPSQTLPSDSSTPIRPPNLPLTVNTTAFPTESSFFNNRKHGSGQVGAHAGVGAHWYVQFTHTDGFKELYGKSVSG
jgi:hypothetical protein